jgi:rhomboid protease GluP
VLDLNHILLFLACVSPLVLLGQTWRRGGLDRGWRLAAFAVLIVTGVSWIVRPATAGFIGGGAWFALLLLPAVGLRKTAELAVTQRFASARRLARLLRLLHPADGLLEQSILLQALELAQRGDSASALALLAPLRNNHTTLGRQAIAASFRISGDWENLLRWTRTELSPGIMQTDNAVIPLYLRALGETGSRDELVVEFAANVASLTAGQPPLWSYYSSLLAVLAFCGRVESLGNLLETKLRKLPRHVKECWIGTSEIVAGAVAAGRARLEKVLAGTNDHLIRSDIRRRLQVASEFPLAPLSPGSDAFLRRIERNDRASGRAFASETMRPTTAVLILIALNVAMFVAEIANGGSMNGWTLHRLGALELVAVRVDGEYWRLLTSLFLHFGPLHLLFNLYALFIIGPGLERALGAIRFGICYLLSGLGSGLGVLFLRLIGLNSAEQLVGASGCVMGLVGAWAGLLLRHRDSPLAGRRLKNILMIVAIQTAFDLSTPQISMAAHMSGLVSGFALGLLFAPRRGVAW